MTPKRKPNQILHAQINMFRRKYKKGLVSVREIAEFNNCSLVTVYTIIKKNKWGSRRGRFFSA